MLLGGLWHGASWTFVVWGGLHGGALAVNRYFQGRFGSASKSVAVRVLKVICTFHFVCLCWIFFRADSFVRARGMIAQIGEGSIHATNLHLPVVAALAVGLVTHFVPDVWFQSLKRRFVTAPALVQGVLLFVAALIVRQMASADAVPFVYFQF
jgi:hypothetical protein